MPVAAAVGVLGLAALGAMASSKPAPSSPLVVRFPTPPARAVDTLPPAPDLGGVQHASAQLITAKAAAWCERKGVPRPVSLSLVLMANAYGESRLYPWKIGDNHCSYGLFQLNTCGGLGADILRLNPGMTAQELLEPRVNVDAILFELGRRPRAVQALMSGTLGQAVDAFVREVERPSDPSADSQTRQAYAERFGQVRRTVPCVALEDVAAFLAA